MKRKNVIMLIPKVVQSTYLCLRFPFLRFRNYNGKPYQIIPTYTWLDSIPYGWRRCFGIQLCKELKESLKKTNSLKSFRFLDIKEKYGRLDVDASGWSMEVESILEKYEYISERTCIACGAPAKYITRGWITPYCENCIDDYKKVNADEYYKDIDWYGYKTITTEK